MADPHFPVKVPENDVVIFFTLMKRDWSVLANLRRDGNCLEFALPLCTLRYLRFVPDDLREVPVEFIEFLAR